MILTLSESYCKTILAYSELKSVFTFLLSYYQTIVNTFLRVWVDTWTERKVLNRKFPSKNEKSWHKHMKQIILPSTVLELYMIGHWWLYGRKWHSLSPKKEIRSPQNRGSPRNLKFYPSIATKYKTILSPSKKIFLGSGSTVYTMGNKDANTDYQKVVRVGDQKLKIVEIAIRISFFFVWDSYSLVLIQLVFKSRLKKVTPA